MRAGGFGQGRQSHREKDRAGSLYFKWIKHYRQGLMLNLEILRPLLLGI